MQLAVAGVRYMRGEERSVGVDVDETAVDRAAERLLTAMRTRRPTTPVRDLIGSTDIDAAYRVQQRVIAKRVRDGATVIGRKIGLTSEAVQRQVGVDRPDFGVLLDDMRYAHGDVIPMSSLLQPRAEVEVAFVLAADIDRELGPQELRAAVDHARAAIEIVDSRVQDWDIAITDTVADNASSGAFVLGSERVPLSEFEPKEVAMRLTDGVHELSTGVGAACLGDPLAALAWLARTAIEYDAPLRAGDVVLSGALGPLAPIAAGQTLTATISALGTVSASFAEA
jgi:2-keto-4-pentenoate hydratase